MLEINVAITIIILLIMLTQFICRYKIGWKYLYALWLMVPVRILLPVDKLKMKVSVAEPEPECGFGIQGGNLKERIKNLYLPKADVQKKEVNTGSMVCYGDFLPTQNGIPSLRIIT